MSLLEEKTTKNNFETVVRIADRLLTYVSGLLTGIERKDKKLEELRKVNRFKTGLICFLSFSSISLIFSLLFLSLHSKKKHDQSHNNHDE